VDFDKKESDLIYEVKIKSEKAYFVLIEIQSKSDRKMAYRLLNYMVEIWRKQEVNLRKKGEKFTLPKIIPCVLYTGKEKWTAPIEFKDLYGDIKYEDYLINFKYILIDVNRYKPENLLEAGNIIASAFYLDMSTREDMEKRLENLAKTLAGADKKTIEEFMRWVINMFVFDEDKQKTIEEKFEKGEKEMGNLAKIGREIYEEGIEKGREEGIKRGIEQGIERGVERGRIAAVKKILIKKLKEENPEVNMLIESASGDKLDELEDKIFEITSWEEVEEVLK